MFSHIKIIEPYSENYDLQDKWEVDKLDISACPTYTELYENEFNILDYRRAYYKNLHTVFILRL